MEPRTYFVFRRVCRMPGLVGGSFVRYLREVRWSGSQVDLNVALARVDQRQFSMTPQQAHDRMPHCGWLPPTPPTHN